jgi:hypothetical protein
MLIVCYLLSFSVAIIIKEEEHSNFIVWINLAVATLTRVGFIGIRVVFEYIVFRIHWSTVYIFIASTSFIYSSHTIFLNQINILIIIIVDLAVVLALLIFAASIKIAVRRRHNITLACRKVFTVIAIICFILYVLFISAMAFINHIQRQI